MKIGTLIVDDHADIRLLLRIMIEAAGMHVRGEAERGEEALEILDVVDPDVVVLDEMMPGISGIETARRIRERRPEQKMIMCTARHLDRELRARAEEVGFALCIGKERIFEVPEALRLVASS